MRIYRPESTRAIPAAAKIDEKKRTVSYRGRDGATIRAVLTDGGKMRVTQGTWHIAFRDGEDRHQDFAAFEDEGDSRILAKQIKNLIAYHGKPLPPDLETYCGHLREKCPRIAGALEACGLLAPKVKVQPEAEPERLAVWVDAFEGWLKATKGDSGYHRNAGHIQTVMGRVRAIVKGCHFETWADIKKQKIEVYLGDLALSNRTHNGYVGAIRQFCTWAVDTAEKAEFSPLGKLKRVKVQHKEKRRPLAFEEVCRLLAVAQNGPVRHGLTGPERAILYLLAIGTGFRRKELFHLTPACFNLSKATVKLDGAYTKNHQEAIQPIGLALASRLAAFLEGMDPEEPLFKLKTPRTAEMIEEDAAEAGLPLLDDKGRELVFHSLRHTLRAELINAHVDSEVVNAIMRHSPQGVGEKHYGHVSDFQKREALSRLPEYPWPTDLQQQAVRTGTDDTSELYGQVYAAATSHQTASVTMRQNTPESGPTTALLAQNQGHGRSSEPMVGGSSPSGRNSQTLESP